MHFLTNIRLQYSPLSGNSKPSQRGTIVQFLANNFQREQLTVSLHANVEKEKQQVIEQMKIEADNRVATAVQQVSEQLQHEMQMKIEYLKHVQLAFDTSRELQREIKQQLANNGTQAMKKKLREKLEPIVRKELEEDIRKEMYQKVKLELEANYVPKLKEKVRSC